MAAAKSVPSLLSHRRTVSRSVGQIISRTTLTTALCSFVQKLSGPEKVKVPDRLAKLMPGGEPAQGASSTKIAGNHQFFTKRFAETSNG